MRRMLFSSVSEDKPKPIRAINAFVASPIGVLMLAIFASLAFAFSREFEFYCFVITYAIYVGLFSDDLSPIMPLFIFCYITPSAINNPGRSEESLFYGERGLFLLAFVSVGASVLLLRIALDKRIGYRRLFLEKRELTSGLLLLGIAFVISGLFSRHYGEYALRNIAFALIQFFAFFLLYFVLTVSTDWKRFKPSYLAAIGVLMGLIVIFELLYTYKTGEVIVKGEIRRDNIYTGWGVYNNLGIIITMAIPFTHYFAAKGKLPALWLLISVLVLGAVFLTCSRSSILTALVVFLISLVLTFIYTRHRWQLLITTLILIGGLAVLALIYREAVAELFARVPKIAELIDGELIIQDSSRLDLYRDGLDAFWNAKLFGQTFYPIEYSVYDFADLESFSSFFPPRWHNTVIQLLASAGLVGISAYAVHRIQTVKLFLARRRTEGSRLISTYIALSIFALLIGSLLDCHLFNVGPVLFYSTALSVFEFGEDK